VADLADSFVKHQGGWLHFWQFVERARKDWGITTVAEYPKQSGRLLICGGGPSIQQDLKTLRKLAKRGGKIWAVNKTYDWLITKGITPTYCCLLDPKPRVADYVTKPSRKTTFFIASQCDPKVFENLEDHKRVLWHPGVDYFNQEWPAPILKAEWTRPWVVIPGPTTVGLRAVPLGYFLGFRKFHLFGLDSSMEGANLHAYEKERMSVSEGDIEVKTPNRREVFKTNAHMAKQYLDFDQMIEKIGGFIKARQWEPIDITVHGSGLLPSAAAKMGLHFDKEMNDKWK
jgi:hypothetical protein